MYSPWSGRDGIAYEDEIVYNGITLSERCSVADWKIEKE